MSQDGRIIFRYRSGLAVALATGLVFSALQDAPLMVSTGCQAAQEYVPLACHIPVAWQQDVIAAREKGYEFLRSVGVSKKCFYMGHRSYFDIMGPWIREKVGPQGEALTFITPEWLDAKHLPTIFRYFPEVEILKIWCLRIDETVADAIANHLPGLTHVYLDTGGVSDYTLKSLARLKYLEVLSVPPGTITEKGFAYLPEYPSLKYFALSPTYNRLVGGIRHLTGCRNLEVLWLGFLGDEDPPPIGAPPSDPPVSGKAPVKRFVPPEVAAELARIPRLKYLCLPFSNIDDDFVRELSKSRTIVYLDLSSCHHLSDRSAEYLAEMKQLEVLELHCKQLTDQSVKALARLPRLRGLSLLGVSKITDASVPAFCQMKNLEYLCLDSTGVSAAGGDKIIEALAPHKLVNLWGKCSYGPGHYWYRPYHYRAPK
jgi:hypothetical protein